VRIAAWAFVVCAVLCVVGIFVPAVELRLDGGSVSRKTSLSLYQLSTSRELVRGYLEAYKRAPGRKLGEGLAAALMPRVTRGVRGHLGDLRDAMSTLDDVDDKDVVTAGRILTATVWTLLALVAVMAGIVFSDTMRERYRRGRTIIVVAIALVVAVAAIAVMLAAREAVWQANDELGRDIVGVAFGAYMLPVAALGALAAAIVQLVQLVRLRKQLQAA
jgi:hypothetical protein